MTGLIDRALSWFNRPPSKTKADKKYQEAMKESEELLSRIRELRDDPSRQIVVDVLSNRKNTPYLTTMYETAQEMASSLKQRAS